MPILNLRNVKKSLEIHTAFPREASCEVMSIVVLYGMDNNIQLDDKINSLNSNYDFEYLTFC